MKDSPSKDLKRRTHERYGIASLAEITLVSTGEVLDGLVSNVSQGGVGVYLEQPVPEGVEVRIRLAFLQTNGNQEITEIIPGRVVWVRTLHRVYVAGIQFTTLDPDRHKALFQVLDEASGPPH